jgi:flagellar basal body-associated protein FliL
MIAFITASGLNLITWIIIAVYATTALALMILFWKHRKNSYQRIEQLEEKMHEHDELIFRQTEIQTEKFKKAIQLHLSEMTTRMAKNEELTNRLFNQLDALKEMLMEVESDQYNADKKPDTND